MPTHRIQTKTFRRGFGLDKIQSDLPLGGVASLIVHSGILLAALMAWQTAPRIMPEDVIAVDMVSDIPSVLGENSAPETAQTGVDTATPAPLPQSLPPAPAVLTAAPTPELQPQQISPPQQAPQPQQKAQAAAIAPAATPPPAIVPSPSSPPSTKAPPVTPARAKIAPTARPTAAPAQTPPRPSAQPTPKAVPKAAPAARIGQRQAAPTAPAEFDLAAASKSATGADSGGRRAPQLASRGQAGRLGKAGGGAQLTGDLEAALRSQIKECWLEPANMADASRLLVVVSIDLGIDGSLLRDPVLVTPSSRAGANPSLVVAIDNALRAVRDCAPFTLPPDRYESWRQVRFNFDPQRMARR